VVEMSYVGNGILVPAVSRDWKIALMGYRLGHA